MAMMPCAVLTAAEDTEAWLSVGYELLQKGCWREEGGCQAAAREVLRKICCLWLKEYQKCLVLEPGNEGQVMFFFRY